MINEIISNPTIITIVVTSVILIFGILSANLSNYFSDILPINRRLGKPICVNCKSNILISKYILFVKCSQCGKRRSSRSFVTLFAFPMAFLILWYYPPARLGFWIGAGLLIYFSIIFIIDLEYRAILQPVVLFGAIILFGVGVMLHGVVKTAIGGISGFGIMIILFYFGVLFQKLIGKFRGVEIEEVALGFGDVYLSGILGLLLGWPGITAGLFLAIIFAGIVSIFIIMITKIKKIYKPFTAIPYAPFLILGTLVLLYRP